MGVQNYTDNKAISAPSWGLAGWLGLSLVTTGFDATYTSLVNHYCTLQLAVIIFLIAWNIIGENEFVIVGLQGFYFPAKKR